MRIPLAVLVVLVGTSVGPILGQTAWSQNADPFAPDPFAPSQQKTKQQPTQSPKVKAAKHPAIDRKADMISRGLQPIFVAAVNRDESEVRILAALGDETTNSFIDTPIDEAIQEISRNHDIPIVIDKRALEEIGLTPDTPVSLSLKNVSLRSFLRLMLRDLDLTYMVKDQVMQITTIEAAEQNLLTKMYRLPDNLVKNSDQVLMAMQSVVAPDTWSTHDGPSVATSINHVLIVSTTSDVHDQVHDFLDTLIETYGE